MSDFRTDLYRRYVSTFKGGAGDLDAYCTWCGHRYGPLLRELDQNAPILELGCGSGPMLEYLKRSGFESAAGIDASQEQVDAALERGLRASAADVFEFLSDVPARYRAVLAIDFLEHFSKDELVRLVPAVHAALEPGGVLIVQTPNGEGLFPHQVIHGDLTHLTVFTPGSLRQLLAPSGFEEVAVLETGPVPTGLRGRLRVLAWAAIKLCANAVRRIETGKRQSVWTENMICKYRKPR